MTQLVVAQLKSLECVSLEQLFCQDNACQPTITNVAGFQADLGEMAVIGEDVSENIDMHTIGASKCKVNETKAMQVVAVRQPVEDASPERMLAMVVNQVQVLNGDITLQTTPEPGRGVQVRKVLAI